MNESEKIDCIGFIMDGNRRWAKSKGLPTLEGHRMGYKKMQEVVRFARSADIPNVVVYAFSTENWNRSKEEVEYLMKLLRSVLTEELEEIVRKGTRVRFVGDRTFFSEDMQRLMATMEAKTSVTYTSTLYILMSYGGRAEIVAAASRLLAEKKSKITEKDFSNALWASDMPDPDLIIRTGGEQRLSNFLPWQAVYSELFFLPTFWPDFKEEEFKTILADFATRERRHGK